MGRVADYVIDLLDEIVGEPCQRERRFPWALGDVSEKTNRRVELPFDAVWESRRLIVEVDEDQHRRSVTFWDKPSVETVSGVSRGKQRAIYDHRKRAAARQAGFTVVEIPWDRRPVPERRDVAADRRALIRLLRAAGVHL
jgi:very-short-patch-repair endonuclease